jgi:Ni/Co efflux regulator RcnB
MKRFALATAAAFVLVGPLATTASAQDYGRYDDRGDDNDRRGGRDDDRRGNRGDNDNDRRGDRSDRGDHRRGDRGRDERRDQRWDGQRHNGYTYNGRWNYGPPPSAYQGRNGYETGYRSWRRGERLPSYYQDRYRTVDYRRAHLRAPPRGYRYVEDDRGDMLLVALATGVILSVILANQ